MKNTTSLLLIFLIALSSSFSLVIAQENDVDDEQLDAEVADDEISLFQVNSESVINARSSPSTTANIAGILQPGEIIEVLEIVEGSLVGGNSIWYLTLIGGRNGYVHSSLLVPASDIPNQSIILELPTNFLPKISVNSIGTATVAPNIAITVFGFQRVGTDATLVFTAVENAVNDTIAALLEANISEKDISPTAIKVSSQDVIDASGGITGEFVFRANGVLTVYFKDINELQNLVTLALENGADIVWEITYTRDDFSIAETQALQDALDQALEHALKLAEGSQVILGPSVTITMSEFTITSATNRLKNVLIPSTPTDLLVSVGVVVEYGVLVR